MSNDLDGFLGGGAPGLPFPVKKTSYTLTLTGAPRMMQQMDFDSGEPLEWPDGNPRMQMVLTGTIPEDEWWDEYDEDNEGEARLFIKSGLRIALREGLKRAKSKVADLDEGAVVEVTYVKDGPKEGRKQPPKIYNIEITPAPKKKAKGAAEFLGDDDEDEEEEAPPKRRRRAAPAEEEEAPPKRRRRAAPVEDEDDEEEAPPPRRRRSSTPVTDEVASAKRNAAAAKKRAAEADDDEDDDEPPF